MKAIMLIGSRNPQGQTARAAEAMISGMRAGNAQCESFFLPVLKIERCRQCDDNGWGVCKREGRCIIEDDFAGLAEKMRAADKVVFVTPVYFGDLSESLKAFLDRLRRTSRNEGGRAGLAAKPAVGICVAGGGGGGSPSCAFLMERTLGHCGFDVFDMVPARRQNLESKIAQLRNLGERFAAG